MYLSKYTYSHPKTVWSEWRTWLPKTRMGKVLTFRFGCFAAPGVDLRHYHFCFVFRPSFLTRRARRPVLGGRTRAHLFLAVLPGTPRQALIARVWAEVRYGVSHAACVRCTPCSNIKLNPALCAYDKSATSRVSSYRAECFAAFSTVSRLLHTRGDGHTVAPKLWFMVHRRSGKKGQSSVLGRGRNFAFAVPLDKDQPLMAISAGFFAVFVNHLQGGVMNDML